MKSVKKQFEEAIELIDDVADTGGCQQIRDLVDTVYDKVKDIEDTLGSITGVSDLNYVEDAYSELKELSEALY